MASYDFQKICSECHRPIPEPVAEWGGVRVDRPMLKAEVGGVKYHLGPRRISILWCMVVCEGRLTPYAMIEDTVYGPHDQALGFSRSKNINQHCFHIRRITGLMISVIQGQGLVLVRAD